MRNGRLEKEEDKTRATMRCLRRVLVSKESISAAGGICRYQLKNLSNHS